MYASNLIDAIRLPFRKDKELYRSFRYILGFYPRNISFYKEALLHKSMAAKNEGGHHVNNERLEYLGDAILDAVVGDIVYRHFPHKREGFLTTTRSRIVQRETLGEVARQLGLDKMVKHSDYTQSHNSYLAGNAFEAMVGAIYLDRGYDYCMSFVQNRILGKLINIDKIAYKDQNYKSKLLEWCQKHHLELNFELLDENRNEDGSPMFRSKVSIQEFECGRGKGFSKKESQQNAAKNALHRLRNDHKLHDTLVQFATKEKNESD